MSGRILLTSDAVGGTWSYSVALARGLAARGVSCDLAVLGPPPDDSQRASAYKAGIRDVIETRLDLDWLAPGPEALRGMARSLAGLAARLQVDSIHLHAPALAAPGYSVPVVAVAHSCMGTWWEAMRAAPMPPEFLRHCEAMREGLHAAQQVIAPSRAFAASLERVYGTGLNIRVVHNGLNPVAGMAPAVRSGILTAGRLWDEAKNVAVLDDAASRAGLQMDAAGAAEGPGGENFAPAHIRLTGLLTQAELTRRMAGAAVFASSALYEPFGLAVLEAAQCGTPLVLSDIPTFRELWDGAALFVPPRDARTWAETLTALLDDPDRRAMLGRAAWQRAQHYTQDRLCADVAGIHQTLWARSPAAREMA